MFANSFKVAVVQKTRLSLSMSSKFAYDKLPRFKRQASALDFSQSIGAANATFYGNLVTSCTGRSPCYSKMSKLILSISQNRGPSDYDDSKKEWSDDQRMTVRGALWTKSEKLRIYFVALLENTNLNKKYKQLYDNLSDDKYKVSDNNADFILNEFVKMLENNDEQLLQCLANYTCTHQSRPLWNELQDNEVDNDALTDQQAILVEYISSNLFTSYNPFCAKSNN